LRLPSQEEPPLMMLLNLFVSSFLCLFSFD
jgi:hypothetical protein